MNLVSKILSVVLVGCLIQLIVLKYDKTKLEQNIKELEIFNKELLFGIEEQNRAMKSLQYDFEKAEKSAKEEVAVITEKAREERILVVKEVVKDDSCENQLRLLYEQIRLFYD